MATKKKVGRPTKYCKGIVDEICLRLSDGRSVRSVCRDEDMPAASRVFEWLTKYPEFQERYAKAKEASAEAIADEAMDIADNATNDWMESNDPNNEGYRLNGEAIARSRLRVDTRKWFLSKIASKKYGDKQQVEHSGKIDYSNISDEQLDAKLAALIENTKG